MAALTYQITLTGPGLTSCRCVWVSPPVTTDHGPAAGARPISPQAVARNHLGEPDGQ
jgi:hypothetical protein